MVRFIQEQGGVAKAKGPSGGTNAARKARRADKPYNCGVCGQYFATVAELEKHFKKLHERQRKKERNYTGNPARNQRYLEAEAQLYKPPRVNLGLWLKEAGVTVVKVSGERPPAANSALQRDVSALLQKVGRIGEPSATPRVLMLVSEDPGFVPLLEHCREMGWRTVAVGEHLDYPSADETIDWEKVQAAARISTAAAAMNFEDCFDDDDDDDDDDYNARVNSFWLGFLR